MTVLSQGRVFPFVFAVLQSTVTVEHFATSLVSKNSGQTYTASEARIKLEAAFNNLQRAANNPQFAEKFCGQGLRQKMTSNTWTAFYDSDQDACTENFKQYDERMTERLANIPPSIWVEMVMKRLGAGVVNRTKMTGICRQILDSGNFKFYAEAVDNARKADTSDETIAKSYAKIVAKHQPRQYARKFLECWPKVKSVYELYEEFESQRKNFKEWLAKQQLGETMEQSLREHYVHKLYEEFESQRKDFKEWLAKKQLGETMEQSLITLEFCKYKRKSCKKRNKKLERSQRKKCHGRDPRRNPDKSRKIVKTSMKRVLRNMFGPNTGFLVEQMKGRPMNIKSLQNTVCRKK